MNINEVVRACGKHHAEMLGTSIAMILKDMGVQRGRVHATYTDDGTEVFLLDLPKEHVPVAQTLIDKLIANKKTAVIKELPETISNEDASSV